MTIANSEWLTTVYVIINRRNNCIKNIYEIKVLPLYWSNKIDQIAFKLCIVYCISFDFTALAEFSITALLDFWWPLHYCIQIGSKLILADQREGISYRIELTFML